MIFIFIIIGGFLYQFLNTKIDNEVIAAVLTILILAISFVTLTSYLEKRDKQQQTIIDKERQASKLKNLKLNQEAMDNLNTYLQGANIFDKPIKSGIDIDTKNLEDHYFYFDNSYEEKRYGDSNVFKFGDISVYLNILSTYDCLGKPSKKYSPVFKIISLRLEPTETDIYYEDYYSGKSGDTYAELVDIYMDVESVDCIKNLASFIKYSDIIDSIHVDMMKGYNFYYQDYTNN